jgi:hypothetical protein
MFRCWFGHAGQAPKGYRRTNALHSNVLGARKATLSSSSGLLSHRASTGPLFCRITRPIGPTPLAVLPMYSPPYYSPR